LIPVLLRDAQPLYREIEGEPDIHKRRERERARDTAKGELFKLYRDAEKRKAVHRFPLELKWFVEAEKARNNGVLPRALGGCPAKEHERLLVAVYLQEAIAALGKRRGRVKLALHEAADHFRLSYDHVRDIHYNRDRDLDDRELEEWRRLVKIELACRKLPAGKIFPEG